MAAKNIVNRPTDYFKAFQDRIKLISYRPLLQLAAPHARPTPQQVSTTHLADLRITMKGRAPTPRLTAWGNGVVARNSAVEAQAAAAAATHLAGGLHAQSLRPDMYLDSQNIAMLLLMHMGLPDGYIAGMVFGAGMNPEGKHGTLMEDLHAVAAAAPRALDHVAAMGMQHFFLHLRASSVVTTAIADPQRVTAADQLVQGAALVMGLAAQSGAAAVRIEQMGGTEIECRAGVDLFFNPDDFASKPFPTLAEVSAKIAQHLAGELRTGSRAMSLPNSPKMFPLESYHVRQGDTKISFLTLQGSSSAMLFVRTRQPGRKDVIEQFLPEVASAGDPLLRAREKIATLIVERCGVPTGRKTEVIEMLKSHKEYGVFTDLDITFSHHGLVMIGDMRGALHHLRVQFDGEGHATISGINGRLNTEDGTIRVAAQSLPAAAAAAVQAMTVNPNLYEAACNAHGAQINGRSAVTVIPEQYGVTEAISRRAGIDEVSRIAAATVLAMQECGFQGTAPDTAVGQHVHAEVLTPKELLFALRAIARCDDQISTVDATAPVRTPFATTLSAAYRSILFKSSDAIESANPLNHMALLAMFVNPALDAAHPVKYLRWNADPAISSFVYQLVGQFPDGIRHNMEVDEHHVKLWTDTNSVLQASVNNGPSFKIARLKREQVAGVDEAGQPTWKSTLEYRGGNVSSTPQPDGTLSLDPASAALTVQWYLGLVAQARFEANPGLARNLPQPA